MLGAAALGRRGPPLRRGGKRELEREHPIALRGGQSSSDVLPRVHLPFAWLLQSTVWGEGWIPAAWAVVQLL